MPAEVPAPAEPAVQENPDQEDQEMNDMDDENQDEDEAQENQDIEEDDNDENYEDFDESMGTSANQENLVRALAATIGRDFDAGGSSSSAAPGSSLAASESTQVPVETDLTRLNELRKVLKQDLIPRNIALLDVLSDLVFEVKELICLVGQDDMGKVALDVVSNGEFKINFSEFIETRVELGATTRSCRLEMFVHSIPSSRSSSNGCDDSKASREWH